MNSSRKPYIDNIRWITVLLLFPYHTFRVYDGFDESFYVKGTVLPFTSYALGAVWPWIMPLLFLISGIGTYYSLHKRTVKEYLIERTQRIFIPLVFGILFLVPLQTYIAERFHNTYEGGYLAQYVLFFTKPTDLTGYFGGFTPAHLWFLLYLFVISLVALPIILLAERIKKSIPIEKFTLPVILSLFLIPALSQVILDIDGKSVGEYLAWFLFGYFLFSKDVILNLLEKHRFILLGIFAVFAIIYAVFGFTLIDYSVILYEVVYGVYAHLAIVTILGMGKAYLNFSGSISKYMTKSSFGIYLLHQQWIVVTAYFALTYISNTPLQLMSILLSSMLLTFASYILLTNIPVIKRVFTKV
ncbi:MAG: acyltransferase family protein [Oscillospiraceae bacterium]|nr:acyltransferase family protein [Oscillospiraceae bacterium]